MTWPKKCSIKDTFGLRLRRIQTASYADATNVNSGCKLLHQMERGRAPRQCREGQHLEIYIETIIYLSGVSPLHFLKQWNLIIWEEA